MRIAPLAFLFLTAAAFATVVPQQTSREITAQDKQKPARTLAGDTRVGVVTDSQGGATVRPVARQRWTPLRQRSRLLPGDQIRTSPRGANAIEIELAGSGSLVMGPGGLIELPERGQVRLYRGELEVRAGKGKTVKVTGPGGFEEIVRDRVVLRVRDKRTSKLTKDPRWLSGYRASSTDEWMGSLVAMVDGRETPLSVGYHKVDVDIHDQIARTTVEQSFVNSTHNRLEGVFYFPLPADASISGFGMWIGDELVEADIVEKQRARAIFEDILRRRKDPGLLEWTGGNMFKARIFPIEAHSEKRIRIRYTQVLPLAGNKVRYRYALRSELLRNRPLRELKIRIAVSSAVPILDASSPTHEVRVRRTGTSVVAEFDAQEYTPDKDFEFVLSMDRSKALTVVPHRRGDDGYFMLLVSPPGSDSGAFTRELTGESDPLELVLIADTSGSMDELARETQSEFIAGLLSLLGAKDRFHLLTCDIDARPWKTGASAVTEANATAALAFLAARTSLGWTDIDKAFAAASQRAKAGAIVVYVGDGIGTTEDADPVALAQRLGRLAGAHAMPCHAVSTSATFEKVVLQAMGQIGGGSVRSAGSGPLDAAYALLSEVSQPAIKDLTVRFDGFRTARVYPETLPNLPANAQQVILGRYLPAAKAQAGTVTLTGTLDGKPVRYTAEVRLPADNAGNSFLPRLWARRHLDALLAQGRTQQVKDDIVAFSEEFGIMTPYTSFLVLESDEDRQRYGVERRVKMRDGEGFFAKGTSAADTAILRQQMKLARTWRLEVRAQMLREIARLGKDLHGMHYAYGDRHRGYWRNGKDSLRLRSEGQIGATDEAKNFPVDNEVDEFAQGQPAPSVEAPVKADVKEIAEEMVSADADPASRQNAKKRSMYKVQGAQERFGGVVGGKMKGEAGAGRRWLRDDVDGLSNNRRGGARHAWPTTNLHFPGAIPVPVKPKSVADPDWPARVLAILRKIDRNGALAVAKGGFEIRARAESFAPRGDDRTSRSQHRLLFSAASWYTRDQHRGGQPSESWVDGAKRGMVASAFRLGRRRDAVALDRILRPRAGVEYPTHDLVRRYHAYRASIQSETDGRIVILLQAPKSQDYRFVLTIDTKRNVLVESQSITGGEVRNRTEYGGFVEVASMWWPTKIDHFDGKGRRLNRRIVEVESLSAEEVDRRVKQAVSRLDDVIFLDGPDKSVAAARQAIYERRGGFGDHLAMVLHHASTQQWDKALVAFKACEAQAPAKPGLDWLRLSILAWGRQGVAFKKRLNERIPGVLGNMTVRVFLAQHLATTSNNVLHPAELLTLQKRLRPVWFDEGEDPRWRRHAWLTRQASLLSRVQRRVEALAVRERLAREYPFDARNLRAYCQGLATAGHHEKAIALAGRILSKPDAWQRYEIAQTYNWLTGLLWQQRRLKKLHEVLTQWIASKPVQYTSYQRHLSVLYFMGREKAADAWMIARFSEDLGDGKDMAQRARLQAALYMAIGQGWNFRSYRMDPKWVGPLAKLARRLVRSDANMMYLANTILSNHMFRVTDEYRTLQALLNSDLAAAGAIEEMPVPRLAQYISWINWDRQHVDAKFWRAVTDRVRRRYLAATKLNVRRILAGHVLQLLDRHAEKKEAIEFLRLRLERSTEQLRAEVANLLFERLMQQPWSIVVEAELFDLVGQLAGPKLADISRRSVFANAIRRLADALYGMRRKHLLGPVKDYEKLPRAELRLKIRDSRTAAQKALVARFNEVAKGAGPLVRPWYEIERLSFAVQLGTESKSTDGEARELLSSLRGALRGSNDGRGDVLARILRERCSLVLAYGAAGKRAPDGLADGVLALYRDCAKSTPEFLDWQYQIYRLLVALDRTAELEKHIRSCIVPGKVDKQWRVALAYILAETRRLEAAATELETVAKINQLGPKELEVLANWYLVLGQDANRERATRARYAAMPDHQLQNLVYQATARQTRSGSGVPANLDPDTLRILAVLLGKSPYPQNHVGVVQNLYSRIKDFRLLACLADGLEGHTPQQIYPYLQRVAQVVRSIHEEATCDQLATRVTELARGLDKSADRRAFLLLSAMVSRRAAEVRNAPGPHIEKSLAAMRAAFQESWLPGEAKLMAGYLAALRAIPHAELAREQLRQLRVLSGFQKEARADQLQISRYLATTLWSYRRHDEALDVLTAGLETYRTAAAGLDAQANNSVSTLLSWLQSRKRFMQAEAFVVVELGVQKSRGQQQWLTARLFDVYIDCLRVGGALSIGRGEQLYRTARLRMEKAMFEQADRVYPILQQYLSLHRTAHKPAGIARAGADVQTFADTRLFELVTLDANNSQASFQTVAQTLHELNGPLSGLRLLVERMEREPGWLRRVNRGGWRHFGYLIANWRAAAKQLDALEPRLLAIVLREMKRDFATLRSNNRAIYQIGSSYFWREKQPIFDRTAMRVIADNLDSPAIQLHVADYLWHGLRLHRRAISVLIAAEGRGNLHEDGRYRLVGWLHSRKRWAESIDVLEKLISGWPDKLQYRIAMIRALHETDKDSAALGLLASTETRFKTHDRWQESVIAQLGQISLTCRFFKPCVKYFEAAIPLHQRTHANRGVGNGTLSHYYGRIAEAYVALGEPDKAVDAAAAGVVAWGSSASNRRSALASLRGVVHKIRDLDGYVTRWNRRIAETGMDAAVIRKAIGMVYLQRRKARPAIVNLRLARELQPNDAEIHSTLIGAYDLAKDAPGACAALLQSIRSTPMNLELYRSLGQRFQAAGDLHNSERAWTSLVEAQPNEAQSHRLLAQHRAKQRRHGDEVVQWRQVVRIRTLAPEGWLSLAVAQGRAGRAGEAKKTLRRVLETKWETRFGDVHRRAQTMLGRIRAGGPPR